jgi:hypothetical protein
MLWIIGILLAFLGSTLHFIVVWNNMQGADKFTRNKILILGITGFNGAIFALLI